MRHSSAPDAFNFPPGPVAAPTLDDVASKMSLSLSAKQEIACSGMICWRRNSFIAVCS